MAEVYAFRHRVRFEALEDHETEDERKASREAAFHVQMLDQHQIRAGVEQVGGKRMPQAVRRVTEGVVVQRLLCVLLFTRIESAEVSAHGTEMRTKVAGPVQPGESYSARFLDAAGATFSFRSKKHWTKMRIKVVGPLQEVAAEWGTKDSG